MTPPRTAAILILVTVVTGWALLAVHLWLRLSSPSGSVLHDSYFVTALTQHLAAELAVPLVPAGLAALLASPGRWAKRWTRLGIVALLAGAGAIAISVVGEGLFQTMVRGSYMPRRESDPLIAILIGLYWLRALGGAVAIAGLAVALVALQANKAKA